MSQPPVMLLLYGTEREALALAPVARAAQAPSVEMDPVPAALGDHPEGGAPALLGLSPQYTVASQLARGRGGDPEKMIRLLEHLAPLLEELQPEMTVVAGDGRTAAAAALLAGYRGYSLAHVGAGFRFRRPGEGKDGHRFGSPHFHRKLLASAAAIHLAPTRTAAANLVGEGVDATAVHITGHPLVDAMGLLKSELDPLAMTAALGTGGRPVVLAAVEGETPDPEKVVGFCRALRSVAQRARGVLMVVEGLSDNPLNRLMSRYLEDVGSVALVPPLNCVQRWSLLQQAVCAVTTGGPLEGEGPYFGVPVLIMGEGTDHPEPVELGANRIVGPDGRRMAAAMLALIRDRGRRRHMGSVPYSYGDGEAARRILQAIRHYLGLAPRPAPFRPAPGTGMG